MAVTFNLQLNLNGWSPLTYAVGNRITSGGNAYQCTFPGSSTSAPTGTGSAINNGGVAVFKWLSAADFTTLAAAIAALPATFTQPITWAFWNNGTILTSGTSPFATLTGHTTTSTNSLTWTCAPGEGIRDALHGGHTALAFNAAAGVSFTLPTTNPGFHVDYFDIFDANVVFDGLQFQNPNATNGCSILAVEPAATGFVARNSIFDYTAQAGMTQLGLYAPSYIVDNSLFVDHQPVTSGEIGVKAEATGAFVNCTAIAPSAPASAVFVVSDVASAGAVVVRNSACFGYVGGIAISAVTTGAVVIDHCATDATSIGSNNTDAGSNLLNLSAATSLVSLATDARPILGSGLLNVGVTDTTDIPPADDIARTSRPQGAAWDIGALEFLPVRLRGSSQARGRALFGPTLNSKGAARALGRAVLTVPGTVPPVARGSSRTSGRGNPTYIQSVLVGDPWSVDFSTDFGPLPLFQALAGAARSSGKATFAGTRALATIGLAASQAGTTVTAADFMSSRGRGTTSGRATGQYIQSVTPDPWTADFTIDFGPLSNQVAIAAGFSKASGQTAGQYNKTLTSASPARATGRTSDNLRALLSSKGAAGAHGKSVPPPASAVLRASGSARTAAFGVGLYSTPASANRGRSTSSAKAVMAPAAALQAQGNGAAAGNLLFSSTALILNVRGGSQSSATSAAMGLSAAPTTIGVARLFARAQINIAQPVSADSAAAAGAVATLLFNALLPSRGSTVTRGRLGPVGLTTALTGRGVVVGTARSLATVVTKLLAKSSGAATAQATVVSSLSFRAIGASQASGAIGTNTQRHLQAAGRGAAAAVAAIKNGANLTSLGTTTTSATTTTQATLRLIATGCSYASGGGLVSGLGQMQGYGQSDASGTIANSPQALLSAGAVATASAAATLRLATALSASGSTKLNGLANASMAAGLTARASSASSGRVVGLGFAPVALVGVGRAGAFAVARLAAGIVLSGTSVGLSAGRCANTQTALLLATGRSHGFGHLAASSTLGLTTHGTSSAAGRLFNRHLVDGLGRAISQSQSRLSGAFNVTPDTSGPRLSTVGALPAFDAMDLGDTDFFSFDWSGRASVLGDPIISAAVTASPSGMSVGQVVVSGSIVQVRIATGSLEETFSLRCAVTLRSGRVLHWSAAVTVADF